MKDEDIPSDGNAQDQSNVKVKVVGRATVKLYNSKKRQVKGQVTKMKLRSKDMAYKLICASRLRKCHNLSKAIKSGSDSVKQSVHKKEMKVKVEEKIETVTKNVKLESEMQNVKNVKVFDLDKYIETRWQKREDMKERHISHVEVNFDKDYVHTQEIVYSFSLCQMFNHEVSFLQSSP